MEEQLTPTPTPVPQKSSHWVWIGVCVLMLLLGIGIGVVLARYMYQKPTSYVTDSPTPSPSADPTANWKTYTSDEYGFSFRYPETWKNVSDSKSTTEFKIETTNNEVVLGTIFDRKADKTKDKLWIRNLDLVNNKSILISYMQCAGMGCKEGSKDIATFDQILSTFKFLPEECGPCPVYTDFPPNFCKDGVIVSPGEDKCGCPLPPECRK